ncbi:MAG: hypothetical protein NZ561_03100 [Phycisphaerae bacterium]|nr:hypothetical protein [Phycisphaerae bacterium]MDW8263433.1 hypothetical protein [Phycisphaerales bacterium]
MKNFLDLLKKNIAIVVCVLVIIAAVVADFVPLGGFRQELRAQAEARQRNYGEIDGLLSQQRTLPILNPGTTEAEPLPADFPTQSIIEAGRKVSEGLLAAAKNLAVAAATLNEKQPLVPGALPAGDFPSMEAFRNRYRRVVDMSVEGRRNSLPVEIMKAGFAITQEDFNREQERARIQITERTAQRQGDQIMNQAEVDAAVAEGLSRLQETLVRRSARECKVYITPMTMQVDQNLITSTQRPDPSEVFWAQIGLWAQEDLFRAIADVNAAAADVTESPIKYLIQVQVSPTFVGMAGPSADPNAPPATPPADPAAPITPNFRISPTGRTSNGVYDVIHLEATMIVEAEKLPLVLSQLGRGRMLCVTQVRSVEPRDPAVFANMGYYFGDKPIVEVQLQLESLFLRDWTVQYMPDTIKSRLGIPLTGAAPDQAPTG